MSEAEEQIIERKLSVLLSEYQQANAEIAERLKMQKQVEQFIVVLASALIAGSPFILEQDFFVVLPLSAVLFCILSVSFFEQDINITVLASYSHRVLRKEMKSLLGTEADVSQTLSWEEYRHKAFINTSTATYLTINRTSLLYVPPILPLGIFLYLKYYTAHIEENWTMLENLALAGAAIGLLVVAFFAVKIPRLYTQIAEDKASVTKKLEKTKE